MLKHLSENYRRNKRIHIVPKEMQSNHRKPKKNKMDEEGSKGIKDRSPKPIMLSTVIIFDIQGQEEVGDEIPES